MKGSTIKPGTWNIPEHPGTSNNYNNYDKKNKLHKNKLVSALNIKKTKQKHSKKEKITKKYENHCNE